MTRKKLFALASLVAAGTMLGAGQLSARRVQQQRAAGRAVDAQGCRPDAGRRRTGAGRQPSLPGDVRDQRRADPLRARAGGMDIVRARGLVTLERVERAASPADHARRRHRRHARPHLPGQRPADMAPLGPFMVVEAILPIAHGHPYKGIRVRSGYNAVSLKTLPGFAEVAPPKEDCAKCLGKYFQAKGAAAPPAKPPATS